VTDYIFLFVIFLTIIAAFLRADFTLTVIYLLLIVYAAGRWWSKRGLEAIRVARLLNNRAFLGEKIPVSLEVKNSGLLPIPWIKFQESTPVELNISGLVHQVVSLAPHETVKVQYQLEGRKRGYYDVGPVFVTSGDIFGIGGDVQRSFASEHLIVYPKIVPLTKVKLPSRSPMGTLRHNQPVFEDPSRVMGKRDYVAGDSLRRVDWKSSATAGRLQVKLFEPSIALETAIFLNLNSAEYDMRFRLDSTELGIVIAASLANWITGQRQAVGLAVNGIDPLDVDGIPNLIPPRRGRAHLMRVLDLLARVQSGETAPFVQTLRQGSVHLPWGTTLIAITSHFDEEVFDSLFQARRAGLNIVLISSGSFAGVQDVRQRAEYFGFPFYQILREKDLDMWRQ
jgi:uncharacterized protein (DUF58 family)